MGLSLHATIGPQLSEGLHSAMVSLHQHRPNMLQELGISLWDIFWITGLPLVGEMYDEFFPTNKLIIDKRLPAPFES